MKRQEYLKTLGLTSSATPEEIKKSYRKLSLKYHPDKNNNSPESTEKFNKLNEAFSYLTNKNGEQDEENHFNFPSMNGHNTTVNPQDIFNMMFNGQNLDNIFNNLNETDIPNLNGFPNVRVFHNGFPMHMKKEKPPPIIKNIEITMEQCYNGCKLPLTVKRWVGKPGMNEEEEKIYIDIPCGIDNNEMLILRNSGHIINDYLKGDIKVFIKVLNNNQTFKREGLNIIFTKDITLKEALCGFTFTIDHISGKSFTIKNNKIIKPGFKTTIQKLGFKRDNMHGNLEILFNVTFPLELSKDTINQLNKIL